MWLLPVVFGLILPIYGYFHAARLARKTPAWNKLWRKIIVLIYAAGLTSLPYALNRFAYIRLGTLDWPLALVVCLSLAALGGPILAILFWSSADAAVREVRFCRYCSYDLSGSASWICPECGKRVRVLDSDRPS